MSSFNKHITHGIKRGYYLNDDVTCLLLTAPPKASSALNLSLYCIICPQDVIVDYELLNVINKTCPNLKQLFIYRLEALSTTITFEKLQYLSVVKGELTSINKMTLPSLTDLDVYECTEIEKLNIERQIDKLRIGSEYIKFIDADSRFKLLQFYRTSDPIGAPTCNKRKRVEGCQDFIGLKNVDVNDDCSVVGLYSDDERIESFSHVNVYIPNKPRYVIYIKPGTIVANCDIFQAIKPRENHLIFSYVKGLPDTTKIHYYYDKQFLKIRTGPVDESLLYDLVKKFEKHVPIKKIRIKLLGWTSKLNKINRVADTVIVQENIPAIM